MQSTQPSMEPDAEIFAEMAQDLLLGPSQAQPGPPSAQSAQPSTQSMMTPPRGYLAQDQSRSWQHVSKPQTAPQQHQQMQQVLSSIMPIMTFILPSFLLTHVSLVEHQTIQS